jgi:hypothetical protein
MIAPITNVISFEHFIFSNIDIPFLKREMKQNFGDERITYKIPKDSPIIAQLKIPKKYAFIHTKMIFGVSKDINSFDKLTYSIYFEIKVIEVDKANKNFREENILTSKHAYSNDANKTFCQFSEYIFMELPHLFK